MPEQQLDETMNRTPISSHNQITAQVTETEYGGDKNFKEDGFNNESIVIYGKKKGEPKNIPIKSI